MQFWIYIPVFVQEKKKKNWLHDDLQNSVHQENYIGIFFCL